MPATASIATLTTRRPTAAFAARTLTLGPCPATFATPRRGPAFALFPSFARRAGFALLARRALSLFAPWRRATPFRRSPFRARRNHRQ